MRVQCALVALIAVFATPLLAHGGGYRPPPQPPPLPPGGEYHGPEDRTPPAGRPGRRPTTQGPNGPTTPGPSGPSSGGPASPGPTGPATGGAALPVPSGPSGPSGPRTGGGIALTEDYTQWHHWWSVNKDRFLRVRDAVHATAPTTYSDAFFMGAGGKPMRVTLRPRDRDVQRDVLPALEQLLESSNNRDVTTACLIALAKFGQDHAEFALLSVLRERLKSRDQQVRETAALAIGIAQQVAGMPDLMALVQDDERGRALCDRGSVDDRTRAFAAYGLGLIASSTPVVAIKQQVFDGLRTVIENPDEHRRDVMIAAICSLGLLRPGSASARGKRLLDQSLDALDKLDRKTLGPGAQWAQAHVATAIARLLRAAPGDTRTGYHRQRLVRRVTARGDARRSNQSVQSAILALGELARPYDDDKSPDRRVSEALLEYFEKGRDKQAAYFALVALGQIGGQQNRSALIEVLRRGHKALERPWAALALGLMCRERSVVAGHCADPFVGELLLEQLIENKNASTRGAMAIALGLARYDIAAEDMRKLLVDERHRPELAGPLCLGLALLDDQRSVPTIRRITAVSLRRPGILRDASVALGMLGDKGVADMLLEVLGDNPTQVSRLASVSVGLGLIGDRRTIAPLLDLARRDSMTELARAFVVVALGNVIDKGRLPFNEPIGANLNYRANVPTLIDYTSGVLDIL